MECQVAENDGLLLSNPTKQRKGIASVHLAGVLFLDIEKNKNP